jgi:uncharacterized membrane protein
MKPFNALVTSAITSLIGLGAIAAHAAEPLVHCAEHERCYGVTKAGKNEATTRTSMSCGPRLDPIGDCSTASSACAGTAKQDFQKDAWIYVPKGTCLKLAGGALVAGKQASAK